MSELLKVCSLLLLIPLIVTKRSLAQNDTTFQLPSFVQDEIEAYLENLGTESEFDFNDLGDHLAQYLRNPLSLNQASFEDLQAMGLLSDIQIADFLDYRRQLGDLTSIYELQSIPSLDQNSIDRIRPFATISEAHNVSSRALVKMLSTGRNEIFLRTTRVLEKQKGYEGTNQRSASYLGSPNQYYVRFKHQFEQKLSYGFTLEKDPGEPFFNRQQPGFDFYSFHFMARDLNKYVQAIALGDFAISMGQGLIMHSGYGSGKGSFVTNIKRGGRSLRPYTSVNEASNLRGAAASLDLQPFAITIFASKTKRDANAQIDSLDQQESLISFSSLQASGLHRTIPEIADKDAITHSTVGLTAGFRQNRLKLNINLLHNKFNKPFLRSSLPYNQFYFQGRHLTNLSFDYSYLYRNFNFYGETAWSDNGAVATLNGLMITLSRYVDLVVLHRDLSYKYQALQATPFIESSVASNEKGLYLGSQIKINPSLWISIYADYWKHPWLRFRTDAPSVGNEHFIRFTYYKKRKLECYIQYKSENKAINERIDNSPTNQLFYGNKRNLRMHINNKINKTLELRNRLEFTSVKSNSNNNSRGFMLYQDVIYKSQRSPLSLTTRICYFDTDDYNSRIYAYENDILYSFSVPPYYDRGIRYYLNLRFRFGDLTLESRVEQTRFADLESVGNGNEKIAGNTKTRIKLQCRYVF
ncbi:MAG: helix-hairpin-helix domain-containing protein [Saprospiraceae bacterium]|nr:helix-hairpin-helix domain-containing protein [Saprospiraceae bacterium]